MKYPRVWEDINDDPTAGCSRLKIHGGWLVVSWSNLGKFQENLIFVPDINHYWELQ